MIHGKTKKPGYFTLLRLGIIFIFLSIAQSIFSQNYIYDSWESEDGLPQNSVKGLIQTRDGYLWLSTEGGLSRFDGISFSNFGIKNTPAFSSNRMGVLFENKGNGDLLVGNYPGGIVLYSNKKFYNLSDSLGLDEKSIFHIHQFGSDKLMIVTHAFTIIILDSQTYKILKREQLTKTTVPFEIFNTAEKMIWVSRESIQIRNINSNVQLPLSELKPEAFFSAASYDPRDNSLWVIDGKKLNQYINMKPVASYAIGDYFPDDIHFKLLQNDDNLYLRVFDSGEILAFDKNKKTFSWFSDGVTICSEGTISEVFIDREKNFWFASSTCGLIKLKPPRFSYLDKEDWPAVRNIYPLLFHSDKRIMLGTHGSGLMISDENENFYKPPELIPIQDKFVSSVEWYNGAVYLGYWPSNNILKWEDNRTEKIYFPNLIEQQVNAIFTTKDNQLLIGTLEGVCELKNDTLSPHPINSLCDIGFVSTFFEDSKENLWIASDKILLSYSPSRDSLLFDSRKTHPENSFYRGIYEDKSGRIFAGSYGYGLSVIENDSLYHITEELGLEENVISTITEDSSGHIWLTGNNGLSRLNKSELLDVMHGKAERLNVVLYNEQTDRLRSGEFNGGIQQAKLWMGGEKYIFPSLKGAVIVDFSKMSENKLPPPVHIEKLLYKDSVYFSNAAVSMDYAAENLDIYFTALSFTSPQNVKFKYKLEGFDKNWIDAGTERKTSYSKIPPGDYNFRVIACNNEGIWNKEGAQIAFSIIPPFYMTTWFKTGILLLLLLLTGLIVNAINTRNRKRERDKSALMDILPDLVFKIDKEGRYLEIYGNSNALSTHLEKKMQGNKIGNFLPIELSDKALALIRESIESRKMQQYEYSLQSANNKLRNFESRFVAIDKNEVLCIIRDITDVTEAQKQIRDGEKKLFKALEKEKGLLKRITTQQKIQLEAIVDTEEKERKRIAADLHDGIGQLLSSVKINLGMVKEKINKSELDESIHLVDKSKDTIEQITVELRNISYNLLPPSLEQFGLASAIAEEVSKLKSNPRQRIHFDNSTTDVKFNEKVEIVLFRSFQELLNNSLKHANAEEITIQLIQHNDQLVLMVEDDGNGFILQKAMLNKDSSGLKNLYSRIEFVNGKINVDSRPDAGTSVIIEIPL